MFKQCVVAVAVFAMSCCTAFGGESWHSKDFHVRARPDVVSQWLKDHAKEVTHATGGELVSKIGDKLRIKQPTPKGAIEFTVRETFLENGTTYDYNTKLVEVHRGGILDQTTKVTLEASAGGTKVTIHLFAVIGDMKAPGIKTGLARSARGFQELVESKFR